MTPDTSGHPHRGTDHVRVHGLVGKPGEPRTAQTWTATRLVLAAGAIGNSKLLLASGFGAGAPCSGAALTPTRST